MESLKGSVIWIYPGLSKRGIFMGGRSLAPYLVVLPVAVSYSWKLFILDG